MLATASLLSPLSHIPDERLAQIVAKAVRQAGVRAMPGLTIEVAEGRVYLHGMARSFYEKQLVLHAARHVPGVREIVDRVEVQRVAS